MGVGLLLAVAAAPRVLKPADREGRNALHGTVGRLAQVLSADSPASQTTLPSGPEASLQCSGDDGCWPVFYMLGAQKAMTTSIFDSLRQRDLVCAARISVRGEIRVRSENQTRRTWDILNEKEPHFLDEWVPEKWNEATQDPGLYTRLYQEADCPSRRFMDATPNYISNYNAPARFDLLVPQALLPQQRFVVVLREPVQRDLSWFNHRAAEITMHDYFCSDDAAAWARAGGYDAARAGGYDAAREAYGNEVGCALDGFAHCLSEAQGAGLYVAAHDSLLQPDGDEALPLPQRSLSPVEAQSYRAWVGCMKSSHWGKGHASAGLYAMQLRRWRQFVPRNQLLVLQQESFEKEPGKHFAALLSFLGLPSATAPELRRDNVHNGLSTPRCATVAKLAIFFEPHNEMLRLDLEADRSSAAPPQEPVFAPWPASLDCLDASPGTASLMANRSIAGSVRLFDNPLAGLSQIRRMKPANEIWNRISTQLKANNRTDRYDLAPWVRKGDNIVFGMLSGDAVVEERALPKLRTWCQDASCVVFSDAPNDAVQPFVLSKDWLNDTFGDVHVYTLAQKRFLPALLVLQEMIKLNYRGRFAETRWAMLVDDDTYVFKPALQSVLSQLPDPLGTPIYTGQLYSRDWVPVHTNGAGENVGASTSKPFALGGGGSLFSLAALKQMNLVDCIAETMPGGLWPKHLSDWVLGECAAASGVPFTQVAGAQPFNQFACVDVNTSSVHYCAVEADYSSEEVVLHALNSSRMHWGTNEVISQWVELPAHPTTEGLPATLHPVKDNVSTSVAHYVAGLVEAQMRRAGADASPQSRTGLVGQLNLYAAKKWCDPGQCGSELHCELNAEGMYTLKEWACEGFWPGSIAHVKHVGDFKRGLSR